jgi:sulfur-oxidizing protein SoxY
LAFRFILALVALGFAAGGPVRAQEPSPADSAIWKKVHASLFGGAQFGAADAVIVLDTPKRAEDAAIVPLAIRARFPQS